MRFSNSKFADVTSVRHSITYVDYNDHARCQVGRTYCLPYCALWEGSLAIFTEMRHAPRGMQMAMARLLHHILISSTWYKEDKSRQSRSSSQSAIWANQLSDTCSWGCIAFGANKYYRTDVLRLCASGPEFGSRSGFPVQDFPGELSGRHRQSHCANALAPTYPSGLLRSLGL